MQDSGDLNPRALVDRLIDRWPVVFVAGVAGGLLALAVSLLLRPRYEAFSSLNVSVNYGRTPPLELIVEDRALGRAEDLLVNPATVEKVHGALVDRFGENPAWSSSQDLRTSMRVDRMLAEWRLVVAGPDPEAAATVANIWAEVGLAELDAATDHGWAALQLQSAPIVVACAELLVGAPLESFWECLAAGPNLSPEKVARLREEVRLSHGVLPVLSFEPGGEATAPAMPIVWSRSQLIVSGMLAGLLAGCLVAATEMFPGKRKL